MAVNDAIVWIYLGRRDKTGVILLAQFNGKKIIPSRIENVDDLKLPHDYNVFIKQKIIDYKLLWEPWIESSSDYASLRYQLKKRGFKNVPLSNYVQYGMRTTSSLPDINTKNIKQMKTMVRKFK